MQMTQKMTAVMVEEWVGILLPATPGKDAVPVLETQ
jgi:hypothetical protein